MPERDARWGAERDRIMGQGLRHGSSLLAEWNIENEGDLAAQLVGFLQ